MRTCACATEREFEVKSSCQSDVGLIERIILKTARDAFVSQEQIDAQWQELNYLDRPDFKKAVAEYDFFVRQLETIGVDVCCLPTDETVGIDSIYPRDTMLATDAGVILCRMGKDKRVSEPDAAEAYLKEKNIPILGRIAGEGRLEGGDIIWLDNKTLAVGHGYRTNDDGIGQLKRLTRSTVDEVVVVDLPHYKGPSDVFHLMSVISPIDVDLAAVYSPLMPVRFRSELIRRGIKLVEVPDDEFESMGCNILTLAPRKVLMIEGNRQTQRLLEKQGVEVLLYPGHEISLKGSGGPTCMTRPLTRKIQE